MRTLRLREHRRTEAVRLDSRQVQGLLASGAGIRLAPSPRAPGRYDLTPGATVGTVVLDELRVDIRPKIPIRRLLFLLSYSVDRMRLLEPQATYEEAVDLLEAVAALFLASARAAIDRGLLQGYREEEDSLTVIRGRIRFDDQIRQRFGQAPPVEVRYDAFTPDIELNRLLKAAAYRLGRLRLRSAAQTSALRNLAAALAPVRLVEYAPSRLPEVRYNRLNEHYRPAVELARMILRGASLRHDLGATRAASFLVDMNQLFEDFVCRALRETLGLSERAFPRAGKHPRLTLDRGGRVRLLPDLSWWEGRRCVFVGDVKYKRTKGSAVAMHPDLYQLLAYTVATGLDRGLLVYAAGEAEDCRHVVAESGTVLEVVTMDVDGEPADVLASIERVATKARRLRWPSQIGAEHRIRMLSE